LKAVSKQKAGYRGGRKMKIFRRISFFVLTAAFFASFIGDLLYETHFGYPLTLLMMGSMSGLTLWSIVFLKAEPNLTRIVLFIVLAYLGMVLFGGLGAGGA
jgi:predicted membrane channel-forming protein YqfA (hemolysin III family)